MTTLDDSGWSPTEGFWRHRPVAVTGATGFLGSHLTAMLHELGANIVILARDETPLTPIATHWRDAVWTVRGDVEDALIVERMLAEYEVRTVFHLAAQSQVGVANRDPASTWSANIMGTATVLEASRRASTVEQIVTASSDKAYGTQPDLPYDEEMPLLAQNPYDVSKACSDLIATSYALTFDLPVCVTRCGNFFGPGDLNWRRVVPGVIRDILEGRRPVIRSDGTLIRDYLYVVDGVLAYLQLAEAMADDVDLRGEAFNFSTETPVSVLDLVARLQMAAGSHLEPDIQGTARHEIPAQHLSAAKARKMLGWEARHTLDEGLAKTVAWYREYLSGGGS